LTPWPENDMKNTPHRHDITDRAWKIIAPHLPGKQGDWGGVARDNRKFINAVMWVLRTGAPWRDLPPAYGDGLKVHRRFSRWRNKGIWKKLLAIVMNEPDFEWLMIDATHAKVLQHACGAKGGNEAIGRTKGG